jgi:hypothetical protein
MGKYFFVLSYHVTLMVHLYVYVWQQSVFATCDLQNCWEKKREREKKKASPVIGTIMEIAKSCSRE